MAVSIWGSLKYYCIKLVAYSGLLLNYCRIISLFSFRYNEETFNCYTFVLTFLRNLRYGNLSKAAGSRTVFCENFIVPRTTAAGKYISLYRKLSDMDCYIQRHPGADVAYVALPKRWRDVFRSRDRCTSYCIWKSKREGFGLTLSKRGKIVLGRN